MKICLDNYGPKKRIKYSEKEDILAIKSEVTALEFRHKLKLSSQTRKGTPELVPLW